MDIKVDVKSHTDEIKDELKSRIPLALAMVGEIVEGYAKEDCPVDTGLLRNSITYGIDGESVAQPHYSADTPRSSTGQVESGSYSGKIPSEPGDNRYSVWVGTNVKYAAAVEYGSYNHKVGKAHFLRDAVSHHEKEINQAIKLILDE